MALLAWEEWAVRQTPQELLPKDRVKPWQGLRASDSRSIGRLDGEYVRMEWIGFFAQNNGFGVVDTVRVPLTLTSRAACLHPG
eukprot:2872536-Pyramimonas_sp.AAC.1